MIIVDLNVLLYATNADAADHEAVVRWWEKALAGDEAIGLPWVVIAGFLRLTTRRGALASPLSIADALAVVGEWLALDNVIVVQETDGHWDAMSKLLQGGGAGGNLVTDAHLAALAICHRAPIATFDRDFERFEGVKILRPSVV